MTHQRLCFVQRHASPEQVRALLEMRRFLPWRPTCSGLADNASEGIEELSEGIHWVELTGIRPGYEFAYINPTIARLAVVDEALWFPNALAEVTLGEGRTATQRWKSKEGVLVGFLSPERRTPTRRVS